MNISEGHKNVLEQYMNDIELSKSKSDLTSDRIVEIQQLIEYFPEDSTTTDVKNIRDRLKAIIA
tara:strand:- start:115 stop:306 length:192 start_codon:yes stop_codon:yes gene_type:complete